MSWRFSGIGWTVSLWQQKWSWIWGATQHHGYRYTAGELESVSNQPQDKLEYCLWTVSSIADKEDERRRFSMEFWEKSEAKGGHGLRRMTMGYRYTSHRSGEKLYGTEQILLVLPRSGTRNFQLSFIICICGGMDEKCCTGQSSSP